MLVQIPDFTKMFLYQGSPCSHPAGQEEVGWSALVSRGAHTGRGARPAKSLRSPSSLTQTSRNLGELA